MDSGKRKRIIELDLAKGIAIFLVVLGHTTIPQWAKNIFYPFHLPFFFLISGYLLNTNVKFNEFLKNRMFRLLIPYLSASIVFYVLWVVKQHIEKDYSVTWLKALTGIFYGTGETLIIDGPLWFLTCLFSAEIIFLALMFLLNKFSTYIQALVMIGLGLGGFLISKYIHLPWSIDVALVVQLFLFTGNKLKAWGLFQRSYFPMFVVLLSIILYPILSIINGKIDMNYRIYGNIFIFYINGLCGSIILLQFTRLIILLKNTSKVLISLGENTISILMFHFGVFFGLNIVNGKIPSLHLHSYWFIYFIFGLVISHFVGIFIKNYPLLRLLFTGLRMKKSETQLKQVI